MNQPLPNYRSYLIRFWRMDNAGQPVWRVTLQEPSSERQICFASLADLCTYLATKLEGREAKADSGENQAS